MYSFALLPKLAISYSILNLMISGCFSIVGASSSVWLIYDVTDVHVIGCRGFLHDY